MMMNHHGTGLLRTMGGMAARCARGAHPGQILHCRFGSRQRPWNGATRLVSNCNHTGGDEDETKNPVLNLRSPHKNGEDGARNCDRSLGPSPSTSDHLTEWRTPSQSDLLYSNNESGCAPSTEWIPPPRPHTEDTGTVAHQVDGGGDSSAISDSLQVQLDWTDAREIHGLMATPEQSRELRRRGISNLPVIRHTLLSRDEIGLCLRETGGHDVVVIIDDPQHPRMGGATGMILATASSLHQLRGMADELVGQLRRRKLHEVGVVGAELGPEGSLRDEGESWFVVDCQNYVVHLMDETTRRCLNLESLWSGRDGMHRLNVLDDDAVDAYVSENPVPDEYGRGSLDMDETLRMLEKIRWSSVPRQDVVATKPKTKKRRGRRG